MTRLLELFSGTKSVSKAIGSRYHEIISVDILEKFEPSVVADILRWDYKIYPPGYFDTIWASPPCTEYSKMKYLSMKPRNLDLADSIVKRTLEIIDYFRPNRWYIENPQTGLLKDRPFMMGIPFTDVDYCMYSDWGYKKKTRIWTAVDYEGKLCNKKCGNINNGVHGKPTMFYIPKSGNLDKSIAVYRNQSRDDMYRIPEKLIIELFDAEII
jgi:site-specific DNA-cytosine methylase